MMICLRSTAPHPLLERNEENLNKFKMLKIVPYKLLTKEINKLKTIKHVETQSQKWL